MDNLGGCQISSLEISFANSFFLYGLSLELFT